VLLLLLLLLLRLLVLVLVLITASWGHIIQLLNAAATAALLRVRPSPVGGKLCCVALAGMVTWQHHLHKLRIVYQPVAILVSLQQQ
jgi:hypothetical protein